MGIGASTTAAVDEGDFDSILTDHLAHGEHSADLRDPRHDVAAKNRTGPTKGTNAYNKQRINDLSAPQAGPSSDSIAIRPISSPVGSPIPEVATAIHHERPPQQPSRGIFAAMFGRNKDPPAQVQPSARLSQSASSVGDVLGGGKEPNVVVGMRVRNLPTQLETS